MHGNTFLRCPTALVRASVYREVGRTGMSVRSVAEFGRTPPTSRCGSGSRASITSVYWRTTSSATAAATGVCPNVTTTSAPSLSVSSDSRCGARRRVVDRCDTRSPRAYEAHRNVDHVLRAVNHYVLGDLAAARAALHQVRLRALAASRAIQRGRMIALALGLRLLTRLPRSTGVAGLFERRWHRDPYAMRAA